MVSSLPVLVENLWVIFWVIYTDVVESVGQDEPRIVLLDMFDVIPLVR